jgi:hypothetical protein
MDVFYCPRRTGQYNSRAGIANVKKSRTKLYFMMGVPSEARIEKIFKNIEFLIITEIVTVVNIQVHFPSVP